ncbi:MBL fold metallo-hydrolase [Phenylobacterium immobile]|uniref:MBL fold metallo-hydrolase n=1 Tax=Phenylobacterium immobile TaxID=21 RepID=UPI000B0762C0|nr:MBL fold metallo-hydrolase [Phenylobacterium immobile]
MKVRTTIVLALVAGLAASAGASAQTEPAKPAPTTAELILQHKAKAKAVGAGIFDGTVARLCSVADNAVPRVRSAVPASTPPRETWYAQPYKVFDNLYWVGTKIHSSWALTTSDGIILIDTLYNYAAEAEIVDGLKALGLNPADVKYVIISHGHGDHDEGARLLQERYGAKVVMGAEDWDLVAKQTAMAGGQPKRDLVAQDGEKITLGDTTVTTILTPGHTPGTVSAIFQVKDHGRPVTVAYSGGTAFVFPPAAATFDLYVASQKKLAKAAADAGATVLLSNHAQFDNAYDLARIAQLPRKAGEPNPFEIGAGAVADYFVVSSECAEAAKLEMSSR